MKKILIELDEPYEHGWLVVAEFAFKCCEKGMNWEATRSEVLKRLGSVIKERTSDPGKIDSESALHAAAERVCWFDWSDNDPDAVQAIAYLRAVVRPKT